MALFRSSSSEPDRDRPPRGGRARSTGPEASRDSSAAGSDDSGWIRPGALAPGEPTAPAVPAPDELDPLADRLQSRLAAFEAEPDVKHVPRADRVAAGPPIDAVQDLNEQLDVLRAQLEEAFEDMDGRIAAARVRADEATARAEAAHARVGEIVTAINQLAVELPSLVANDRSDLDRLRVALARLKDQIEPDRRAEPAAPADTAPPPEAASAPGADPAP